MWPANKTGDLVNWELIPKGDNKFSIKNTWRCDSE